MSNLEEHAELIERKIMEDKFVATWYDLERNVKMNGEVINVVIRGNTGKVNPIFRPIATLLRLPSWEVAALIFHKRHEVTLQQLSEIVRLAEDFVVQQTVKFVCVIVVSILGFDESALEFSRGCQRREVGLVLASLRTRTLYHNRTVTGERFSRIIRSRGWKILKATSESKPDSI